MADKIPGGRRGFGAGGGLLLGGLVLASGAGAGHGQEVLFHQGMCDASAAVALDGDTFAVANDEDNVIRVYRRDRSGPPVYRFEAGPFLQVDPLEPETDLEGATWLEDRIYWITSHGRNKKGNYRSSRHRFFALKLDRQEGRVSLIPEGRPYQGLLRDLCADPRLARFGLARASLLAPKDPGGFNIEGLCATPQGELLIGFRNPIPDKQALLVPLINPSEVVLGGSPRFGDPILLDLAERGVRDVVRWQDGYLLVAGDFDKGKKSRLYYWRGGKEKPQRLEGLRFTDENPEAVVVYPNIRGKIHLLSDDGTLDYNGVECKALPNPDMRQFRSLWLEMPVVR